MSLAWDTFTGGNSVSWLDPLPGDTGIPGVGLFRPSSIYGVEYPEGYIAVGFGQGSVGNLPGLDAPGYLVGTRREVDAFLAELRGQAAGVTSIEGAREAIVQSIPAGNAGGSGVALGVAAVLAAFLLSRRR